MASNDVEYHKMLTTIDDQMQAEKVKSGGFPAAISNNMICVQKDEYEQIKALADAYDSKVVMVNKTEYEIMRKKANMVRTNNFNMD